MSKEIRQLIENYYDIQKIRVETFNRIVMFIKENEKKIIEALSHLRLETHFENASHQSIETQIGIASQKMSETRFENASQKPIETQFGSASQNPSETQFGCASHGEVETQFVNASHEFVETHFGNASHEGCETHFSTALKLLKEKKYAEFVRKYIISQGSCETHIFSALSPFIKQVENLIWFHNKLYETEKGLYKRLDAWSKNHPLRKCFLNYVKGIGPVLSSGIIAWYSKAIFKANHVSQIWSYSGLAPNQERKRGEKVKYNPKLKTFCWKIGQSFIKFKCFGRKLYEEFKELARQKHPDWSKLHLHNYARRKVVKLFLASVWEVWRKMNNLPTTKPYPIEVLGHMDIITPEMWMERKKEDYEISEGDAE